MTHRTLTNTAGSTRLDPKYFQSHPTIMTNNLDKPNSISNNNARINKQLMQQGSSMNPQPQQPSTISPNQYSSKTAPSLASAYFPPN